MITREEIHNRLKILSKKYPNKIFYIDPNDHDPKCFNENIKRVEAYERYYRQNKKKQKCCIII